MANDTRLPPDPGVEAARDAAPNPGRTKPMPPQAETAADLAGARAREAGEEARDERSSERRSAPAPFPARAGADVNDRDDLEPAVDRFLGTTPSDDPVPRR